MSKLSHIFSERFCDNITFEDLEGNTKPLHWLFQNKLTGCFLTETNAEWEWLQSNVCDQIFPCEKDLTFSPKLGAMRTSCSKRKNHVSSIRNVFVQRCGVFVIKLTVATNQVSAIWSWEARVWFHEHLNRATLEVRKLFGGFRKGFILFHIQTEVSREMMTPKNKRN